MLETMPRSIIEEDSDDNDDNDDPVRSIVNHPRLDSFREITR
jgi:hypothetical protein